MSCCSSLVQADYGQSDGDEFLFGSDPDDVISDLLGVRDFHSNLVEFDPKI